MLNMIGQHIFGSEKMFFGCLAQKKQHLYLVYKILNFVDGAGPCKSQ